LKSSKSEIEEKRKKNMKFTVLPCFVQAKSLLFELMGVGTRTNSTLKGQKQFVNNNTMPQKPLLCTICFKSLKL